MAMTFVSTTDSQEQLNETAKKFGDVEEQPAIGEAAPKGATDKTPSGGESPKAQAGTDTASPGAPGTQQGDKGKPKREDQTPEWQKRAITRERNRAREAREEADRLRQELETFKSRETKTEEVVPEPDKPKASLKPTRDQFATDEEYEEAYDKWSEEKARRIFAEEREREQETANQKLQRERTEAVGKEYDSGIAECAAEFPDWEATMEYAKDNLKVPEATHHAVMQLGKDGPRMAYWLAHHPEAVTELNGLDSGLKVVLAVGRFYSQMQGERASGKNPATTSPAKPAASKDKPRPTSTAPAPQRPLPGGGTTADGRPDPNDPDFFKKRQKWLREHGDD